MSYEGYKWWSGHDEEWMQHGPFETRGEAIHEAQQDATGEFQDADGKWKVSAWVVEASNPPLKLSEWISADRLLEFAEEQIYDSDRICSEYDEGPYFEVTPDQEKDLVNRVRATIDAWQSDHDLAFSCNSFAHIRSSEHVIVPHPNGETE